MKKDILKKANYLSNNIDIIRGKLDLVGNKYEQKDIGFYESELIDNKFTLTEEATDKIIVIARQDLESQLSKYKEEFEKL